MRRKYLRALLCGKHVRTRTHLVPHEQIYGEYDARRKFLLVWTRLKEQNMNFNFPYKTYRVRRVHRLWFYSINDASDKMLHAYLMKNSYRTHDNNKYCDTITRRFQDKKWPVTMRQKRNRDPGPGPSS